MSQSNSGSSACSTTASGARSAGVKVVVDLVGKHPGMDSFCLAWLHAGGEIRNGQLVGTCERLPPLRFASVISLQKRVLDAQKLGKIEECSSRAVVRKHEDGRYIYSKTYKLPGHVPTGVSMSRPDQMKAAPSPVYPPATPPKPKTLPGVDPGKSASWLEKIRADNGLEDEHAAG